MDTTPQRILGIFAKHPRPGFTKTRLASGIGPHLAARFSEAFLMDLIERLTSCCDRLLIAVTPNDNACQQWFQHLQSDDTDILFQPEGGLGQKIEWFFEQALVHPGSHAVLMGSDSPDLPTSLVTDAFDALSTADTVLGPASDGGFTLIGSGDRLSETLSSVPFSCPTTYRDTAAALKKSGRTVRTIPSWFDVDDVQDLRDLKCRLNQQADSSLCPRTRHLLEQTGMPAFDSARNSAKPDPRA